MSYKWRAGQLHPLLLFAPVGLYLFLAPRVIHFCTKIFDATPTYPVWTGHWLGEEEGFLVGTEVAKVGFLVGKANGKAGVQSHPAEPVQMHWAGNKEMVIVALAGSNHLEMNSWVSQPSSLSH